MLHFTSDLHFGHRAVIGYCERPFPDVECMNRGLVERWNAKVKPEDTVYILGDLSFQKFTDTKLLMLQLVGKKILVQGNHDKLSPTQYKSMGFDLVLQHAQIRFGGHYVWLSHYPYPPNAEDMADVHKGDYDVRYLDARIPDRGSWLLHGHVHCAWKQRRRMINVGVDVWNYAPVSQGQIEAILNREARA